MSPKPIIDIEIDASDLLKLADAMPVVITDTQEELVNGMNESGMLLDTLVVGWTPSNYGLLRSSIQWPHGFELQGRMLDEMRGIVGASDQMSATGVSTSTYVDYVEQGTRPHWVPIQPLKLWAIRVLNDERAAYAVQWTIARYGTWGYHMFLRAWQEGGGRDGVKRIFEAIPAKIVERLRRRAGGAS